MGRPRKSTSGRMLKIFSYPGDLNEFLAKLQDALHDDRRTFSDYIVELVLEDSKKRYPKIGASEYLKKIQERQKALAEAEGEEVDAAIKDLRFSMKSYPKDPTSRHEEISKALKKHQPLYIRTGSKDLKACMDEARAAQGKIVEEAKRGS